MAALPRTKLNARGCEAGVLWNCAKLRLVEPGYHLLLTDFACVVIGISKETLLELDFWWARSGKTLCSNQHPWAGIPALNQIVDGNMTFCLGSARNSTSQQFLHNSYHELNHNSIEKTSSISCPSLQGPVPSASPPTTTAMASNKQLKQRRRGDYGYILDYRTRCCHCGFPFYLLLGAFHPPCYTSKRRDRAHSSQSFKGGLVRAASGRPPSYPFFRQPLTPMRISSRPSSHHYHPLTLRFHSFLRADNDMYQHMNNSVYNFLYASLRNCRYDSVVNAYLIEHCGLSPLRSDHDYFASIAYPAVAQLALRVNKLGKSSVTYEIALFEKGFTHVFVERSTGRNAEGGNKL
ncbi:thioesterase superfamily protein [Colletotrichum cuscutae]|uniref:Thioesterase superfamily protein n=1 Tax=Colletotrichum cuscutae TaxID=1209917 RepID=A0AAI9U1D5_9PEZI|nr:thioesterase superfamily protein [Colletotrichum cuscutae]